MVRLAGIEPTTPWFVAKYSIQLSYSREAEEYSAQSISRGGALALLRALGVAFLRAPVRPARARRRARACARQAAAPRQPARAAGARLPHSWRSMNTVPTAAAIAGSPGRSRSACFERGSQSRADARTRVDQRQRDTLAVVARRARPSRSHNGRSQARASSAEPRRQASAAARTRHAAGRDGRRRRAAPRCGAAVAVARRIQRLGGQRAQQARSPPPARTPGVWPAAAPCAAPRSGCRARRCACSFSRSACVRRATPGGSSASSSSARGASRSSSAHSAASSRAPSSPPRARVPRPQQPRQLRAMSSSRRVRSCSGAGWPAPSRWPSDAEVGIGRQRVGVCACERQRAHRRLAAPGCSAQRSTRPAPRAAPHCAARSRRSARHSRGAPRQADQRVDRRAATISTAHAEQHEDDEQVQRQVGAPAAPVQR